MNEIKYPQGCKDIQVDIPNDELIRRLKVNFLVKTLFYLDILIYLNRKFNKHIKI